jgi:hypothetical protein
VVLPKDSIATVHCGTAKDSIATVHCGTAKDSIATVHCGTAKDSIATVHCGTAKDSTYILGKECPLMLATNTRLKNKLSNFYFHQSMQQVYNNNILYA